MKTISHNIVVATSITVLLTTGSLVLSGCTAGTNGVTSSNATASSSASSDASSTSSSSASTDAWAAAVQSLFSADGKKFSEVLQDNPGEIPDNYDEFLVEDRSSGESTHTVSLTKGRVLALRTFCDSAASFTVDVMVGSERASGYSGKDCGPNGPLAEYITPPINATEATVVYKVAGDVGYRTMIATTAPKD